MNSSHGPRRSGLVARDRPASGIRHGFTLVEVLIATAATVALSAIALATLGALADQGVRLSRAAATNAQARAALDRAVDDLQAGRPVAPGVSVTMVSDHTAEITIQERRRRAWIPVAATP